jgi:hypothetical protein
MARDKEERFGPAESRNIECLSKCIMSLETETGRSSDTSSKHSSASAGILAS